MTTMTAAELQTTREALGLTGDWLAEHLDVSPRTVRHWEQGKYAVPAGVDRQIHELEGAARRRYESLVADAETAIGEGQSVRLTVYRTTEDYHAAHPGATMPASWHRAIAHRVREHLITVGLEYPGDAPVSHTETFDFSGGSGGWTMADLALSPDVEERLRDALDGDKHLEIAEDISYRITAKLREYGVDPETGEWFGPWSAERIVTQVLDKHA